MAKSKVVKKKLLWRELGAAGVGAVIGGALGMLFSPKDGAKNRKLVVKKAKKITASTVKAVKKELETVTKTAKK